MHWYKHNLGDYASDTAGLTLLEHGAYRLLLDAYYSNNGRLSSDRSILYRICRARRPAEMRAVRRVVGIYFLDDNSYLKNSRADQEILKYQSQCVANRRRIVAESASEPEAISQKTDKNFLEPIASSDKSLSATDPMNGVMIPLANKTEWGLPKAFLTELELAYPRVDVVPTLREIRVWCVANPTQCKTERGVRRFVNRWFEREQNRG